MIYTVDELLKIYNQLLEIVKVVAMPAKEQLLKPLGCVTDEIALDYCEIGMMYVKILFENGWFSDEQYSIAKDLEFQFDKMEEVENIWEYSMLESSKEWETCRRIAKKLLEML